MAKSTKKAAAKTRVIKAPAKRTRKAPAKAAVASVPEVEEPPKIKAIWPDPEPEPVKDAKAIWSHRIWKWVALGVVLIVGVVFVWQGCNKNAVEKNEKAVADTTQVIQQRQINIDSMLAERDRLIADSVWEVAARVATQGREEAERTGEKKEPPLKK